MCSSQGENDPSTYDTPVTQPRRYVLSGTPRKPSVALAVIGTMLTEAEEEAKEEGGMNRLLLKEGVIPTLLEARDRVAEAEAAL